MDEAKQKLGMAFKLGMMLGVDMAKIRTRKTDRLAQLEYRKTIYDDLEKLSKESEDYAAIHA